MKAFLWMLVVLFLLTAAGKLVWLVRGQFPLRTAKEAAWDIALGLALAAWAGYLLVTWF